MIKNNQPLSSLMRPSALEDIIGQDHLFSEFSTLKNLSSSLKAPSLILWGPAGCGKTSIAKIIANIINADFVMISAVESNVAEIRKKIEEIKLKNNPNSLLSSLQRNTVMMVDEIHHFNKTQQDLFLPFIEDGTIIMVGTTTHNPSFALNSALLSRCKVLVLKALDNDACQELINRAEKFTKRKLPIDPDARKSLIELACGDARYLLNSCEELLSIKIDGNNKINSKQLLGIINKRAPAFDNKGDRHYDLISAFHKSLRGSDVDAALYYLLRMLNAGQDPFYILRRLARFATEDIGIADPNALTYVMAAKANYEFLGSPEGDYALSCATIYCATSPKSNAAYLAHKQANNFAQKYSHHNPPKHLLNAATNLMKQQGYGQDYIYDHDTVNCFSGQDFFPYEVKEAPNFYKPNIRGFEKDILKRLDYWQRLKKEIKLKKY